MNDTSAHTATHDAPELPSASDGAARACIRETAAEVRRTAAMARAAAARAIATARALCARAAPPGSEGPAAR